MELSTQQHRMPVLYLYFIFKLPDKISWLYGKYEKVATL